MLWTGRLRNSYLLLPHVRLIFRFGYCISIRVYVCLSVGSSIGCSVGPLVRWSIGPLVSWSVGQSVRSAFVKIAKTVASIASVYDDMLIHPMVCPYKAPSITKLYKLRTQL